MIELIWFINRCSNNQPPEITCGGVEEEMILPLHGSRAQSHLKSCRTITWASTQRKVHLLVRLPGQTSKSREERHVKSPRRGRKGKPVPEVWRISGIALRLTRSLLVSRSAS